MTVKVDAVTVCVNYADFFQHTVDNRHCFDTWLIITVPEDHDTIDICKQYDIKYCFSDRIFLDDKFHKGKALNDGLSVLQPDDWVCVIDADSLLVPSAFQHVRKEITFETDCLYGVRGRFQLDSSAELTEFLKRETVSTDELLTKDVLVGYFQMCHSSMRAFCPEESQSAGLDDVLMREGYHEDYWRMLPIYTMHLGPMFKNHKGRKTEKFI